MICLPKFIYLFISQTFYEEMFIVHFHTAVR